jgi:hypothetical protein
VCQRRWGGGHGGREETWWKRRDIRQKTREERDTQRKERGGEAIEAGRLKDGRRETESGRGEGGTGGEGEGGTGGEGEGGRGEKEDRPTLLDRPCARLLLEYVTYP